MRKSLAALLLAFGATAIAANLALAALDDGEVMSPKLLNASMSKELRSRATRLGSSGPGDDTTYVGYTPGMSGSNYWSIYASSSDATAHRPPFQGSMWGFDTPYLYGDSLQGWWSIRDQMSGTGGITIPDHLRPWRSLDFGNQVNYAFGRFGPGTARPGSDKRTFGVVGVWHVDKGNTQVVPQSGAPHPGPTWTDGSEPANSGGVKWAPLTGTSSAWMGLRRHGDNTHVDDVARGGTGNPYNEDTYVFQQFNSVSTGGTDKKFPGYGSSMDQMLYRDISLGAAGDTSLTVSFQYRTSLSTRVGTNNLSRAGWFQHDPMFVRVGGTDPTYIQNNSTVANPPADSFMVYIGAPAEGAVQLSDGETHTIYDAKRRWFSEVIRSVEGDVGAVGPAGLGTLKHKQIHSSGDSVLLTTKSVTIPGSILGPIRTAGANKVRLVFRVKTNHLYDDALKVSLAYSSFGSGAAIIDQVQIAKGAGPLTLLGGFESPNEIVNGVDVSAPIDSSAEFFWKSTGKAPENFHHAHFLSNGGASTAGLQYDDLCGQVGSVDRICDMKGVVVSAGNHENDEASGSQILASEQEPFQGIFSPVINLSATASPNNMGLTASLADPTDDYYVDYELYTGIFDFFHTGNAWRVGFQSYPSGNTLSGTGEHERWGDTRYLPFIYFNPDLQCFRGFEPVGANGLLRTTSPDGIPDSCRIFLGTRQETYRFGIPDHEYLEGAYWDNISFAIVDGAPAVLSMSIWDLYSDTFPMTDKLSAVNVGVPAFFDTTVALIRAGINIAPSTNTEDRFDVPGDTTAVQAEGDNVRVDMVFRILPGPGNYRTVGDGFSGLRRNANSSVGITLGDLTNFWSSYLNNNGENGTTPHTPRTVWSPHVWNSARMDTSQANVFQMHGRGVITPASGGVFMTTYHESDARGGASQLGIARNICFVAEVATSTSTQAILCGSGNNGGIGYPPPWVTGDPTGVGYNGSSTTVEGTKIIPDGLLTPGSHVEYFFRREDIGSIPLAITLAPDTTVVTPQNSEGSTDGHRWQQFGVLPDTWKRTTYTHPVLTAPRAGMACMLYIDQNDRRGNERTWVGVADSIGATKKEKYGAHNGWHSADSDGVNGDGTNWNPALPDLQPQAGTFVPGHFGQPGTTWDMYGVKAAESLNTGAGSIGSRGGSLGYSESNELNPQINGTDLDGKTSRLGPSLDMLESYYRILMFLSGDLNSAVFGPFLNKSQDDISIQQDWLLGSTPGSVRGYYGAGDGFVESNYDPLFAPESVQDFFMSDYLGVTRLEGHYRRNSGDTNYEADLLSTAAIDGPGQSYVYGVRNTCTFTLDVLDNNPSLSNPSSFYEGGVWISGVLQTPASSPNDWISLVDGFNMTSLTSQDDVSGQGRRVYLRHMFANVFNSICTVHGASITTGDTPQNSDGRLFNFMSLANNPMKSGSATINFGIAKSERVKIQIFDVGGRLVRTLADRKFTAGEHKLTWDGVDNSGGMSARGVYFVRSKHADSKFTGLSKLIVLK